MAVATYAPEPFPPGTEMRLEQFSELVATSIANADARAEVERLAREQAALRRVATLVAEGVPPAEIFSSVSEEVGRLLGTELASVSRFEQDPPASVVMGLATSVPGIAIGSRWELDGPMASGAEPARRLGVVSTISSPIVVEGRLWGTVNVAARQPLPPDSAERLEKFSDVVATAIASAESREALRRLAEEQAALRRVATLVAQGAPPTAVFDAVAAEMEALLEADQVALSRYEPDSEVTVVAHRGTGAQRVPPGTRVSHEGESVTSIVRRTERPAWMDYREDADGTIAKLARSLDMRVAVGAPVVVDGRLWGVIQASWRGEESPPDDTEERMSQFAQLLDTAIANADGRDQLRASRARLIVAGDEARRRLVRDLHDGAQQRLVHTIVTLKMADRAFRLRDGKGEAFVGEALDHAQQANSELRELAHGILPATLTSGGLLAGVESLVQRFHLPIDVDLPAQRFPAEIEASAYFIVAEALTNVVKHARARHAEVRAIVEDGVLRVQVRDDGTGGADPEGHGLVGIGDRVSALGGRLEIDSPPGGGTLLVADLLLPAD
jgi:signal transduction histidine kinase